MSGNKADSNGSDGMLIGLGECATANDECPGNKIKLNVARFNAGWGIHAAAGNTHGGGNKASPSMQSLSYGRLCERSCGDRRRPTGAAG